VLPTYELLYQFPSDELHTHHLVQASINIMWIYQTLIKMHLSNVLTVCNIQTRL
jgi:hypothetical protein